MLITKEEIRKTRELSNTVKTAKINQYILDAEISDLRPILGEELYTNLAADPTATGEGSYPNLMNPYSYTYGGYYYSHPGLKAVLVDFAFARYRFFGQDTDTPFGVVQKQTKDGINVDIARNREVYSALRKVARDKWALVKQYLDRMSGDANNNYTYWFGDTCQIDDDQDLYNINKSTLN